MHNRAGEKAISALANSEVGEGAEERALELDVEGALRALKEDPRKPALVLYRREREEKKEVDEKDTGMAMFLSPSSFLPLLSCVLFFSLAAFPLSFCLLWSLFLSNLSSY